MAWHRIVIGTLLVAVLLAMACMKDPALLDRHRQAVDLWGYHEGVVENAIHGRYDMDQFMESVDFLSRVSGIDIQVEMFTMGYLPTKETARDLKLAQKWFHENRDRLYYDPESESVRVLQETE